MAEQGNESLEDKTEEPSQHKIEKFRQEGNVAQSKEVTSLIVLLACVSSFYVSSQFLLDSVFEVFRHFFSNSGTFEITNQSVGKLLRIAVASGGSIVLPVAIAGFVAGVAGTLVQIGFNLTWKPLEPKFSKINPLSGIKRIASAQSLVEGLKSILKLSAVIFVTYLLIKDEIFNSFVLSTFDSNQLFSYMGSVGFRLVGGVSVALVVIAALDFFWQKYSHLKKLRMSRKEVKDELKQKEGDPLLKSRVRSVQKEIAKRRMVAEVPSADVIVTNPTHIAVAIKYSGEDMAAPKVVAKGADFVAQKIKDIAKKSDVPLVENVPLARALHKNVKIGEYIPRSLYKAVAEVLAYIYRLKGKKL